MTQRDNWGTFVRFFSHIFGSVCGQNKRENRKWNKLGSKHKLSSRFFFNAGNPKPTRSKNPKIETSKNPSVTANRKVDKSKIQKWRIKATTKVSQERFTNKKAPQLQNRSIPRSQERQVDTSNDKRSPKSKNRIIWKSLHWKRGVVNSLGFWKIPKYKNRPI